MRAAGRKFISTNKLRKIKTVGLIIIAIDIPLLGLFLVWRHRKDWFKRHRVAIALLITWCIIWLILLVDTISNPQATVNDIKSDTTITKSSVKSTAKTKVAITTKTETSVATISFAKTSQNDSTLAKGETKVSQAGVNGEETTTYSVEYQNGKEISRKQTKQEVTKKPVDEVTLIGTYVEPTSAPSTTSTATTQTSSSPSVYYADCTEAREAGAAPIYRGQPGYRSALDRDRDGVACE